MSNTISFVLNGVPAAWDGPDGKRLLDVLREDFHLTGVKCGCTARAASQKVSATITAEKSGWRSSW